ncbi:c-type cytochrome [Bacillus sp. JJ1562]|uniref:c-type cytochrome n=1 Tax=Bacillus sp. JJ1562 TaxID=3122960 RepID=UPI0030037143
MKKILWFAFCVLLIGLLGACSDDQGEKDTSKESESPATTLAGEEVFQESCITCHSSGDITGGQAKLDATKIHSDFKSKDELNAFVSKNMPKSSPGSLSEKEYDAVVNYLWDQK